MTGWGLADGGYEVRRIAYALVWLLGLFSGWVDARAGEGDPLCGVNVFADRAEFLFPLHDATQWRWFRQETAANTPEYGWEVAIPAETPRHVIGAYLFKRPGDRGKSGDLVALIADTHSLASRIQRERKGERHVVEQEARVEARVQDNGVVLTLAGGKAIDKLLAGKPKTARFNIWHPDAVYNFTCTAPIDYQVVIDARGP